MSHSIGYEPRVVCSDVQDDLSSHCGNECRLTQRKTLSQTQRRPSDSELAGFELFGLAGSPSLILGVLAPLYCYSAGCRHAKSLINKGK